MQIDWLTVTAQVANFLILIFLLHRFLYGPIVRAMDRRQRAIDARFEEAGRKADAAEDEAQRYRDLQRELDERKEGLLAAAHAEADVLRERLNDEARREIESRRAEWLAQLHREQQGFLQEARLLAAEQLVAVARRALAELADTGLEEHIVGVFIDRLGHMDANTRRQFAHDCRESGNRMLIVSRFELPSPLRARLTRALHEAILPGAEVAYEHDVELVCGLQLVAGGHVVAWNLSGYLDGLGEALTGMLRDRSVSDAAAAHAVPG